MPLFCAKSSFFIRLMTVSLWLLLVAGANAQTAPSGYVITTVTGNGTAGFSGDGGVATSAELDFPSGVAVDGAGNLFIADYSNNRVRKVTPSGTISTVVGNGTAGFSGDGGPATSAELNGPSGVAVDGAGNLFIADYSNNRVRKVTPSGTISTVAGNGTRGFSGDGGPATSAELDFPSGVAVDGAGNLFVGDQWNNRIRKVTPAGAISTVAGNGTAGFSGDGGPATSAELFRPGGGAVDGAGDLYIADMDNYRIRKVTPAGTISTVAGNGSLGFSGDGGPATSAELYQPTGVAVDGAGDIFIADNGNSRIRFVAPAGTINTVAGNGAAGFGGDGGQATSAEIDWPTGLAVDSGGDLFITDYSRLRVLTPMTSTASSSYTISTVVGNGTTAFSGDGGPASSAALYEPADVAVDGAGNLYIADTFNYRIRKVTPAGAISTVAGNGISGFNADGGPATSAELGDPYGVAVDSAGNLYIADTMNSRIRKVTPAGTISTVAGNGTGGFSGDGGPATSAELSAPFGVAVDGVGNLFIADTTNSRIRKVTSAGTISTVAGNGTFGFSGDGGPATSAGLSAPFGVAVDGAGNLFVADAQNNRIRKVTPTGTISTVAGNGTAGVSGDGGQATSAELNRPLGVVVDSAGNLFIADTSNSRIRRVTPAGTISTVAGNGTGGFSGDGGPATSAELDAPFGVALDGAGDLFIADTYSDHIRKLTPIVSSPPTFTISKTHSGNFSQGVLAETYTVTVGNLASSGPTSGTVTVAENPPTGLTIFTMSGSGWSCSGNTCTRSDVLSPGSSYPAITVLVSVAWNAPAQVTNQVTVSGGGSAMATASDPTTISATQAGPSISAVENAASFLTGFAPNAWLTITGSNLASVASDTWQNSIVSGQLPTILDGVSVNMGGQPAYVYFVSPGQINAVAPNIAAGPTNVVVKNSLGTSAAFSATAQTYNPAFFLWPGGYAVATHQDFSLAVKNGTFSGVTTVAAKPGDVIILWGTGFGPTTPPAPVGAEVPVSSFPTSSPVGVTVGSTPATVYGAALAPGYASLFQVAIQVPTTLADGDYPVVATVMGVASPSSALISVQKSSTPSGTGSLQVQISGLPSGTAAKVVVTSAAGYNSTLTSSQTLQVAAGSYSITATSVLVGNVYYGAFPVQQVVKVTAGSTSTVQVTYNAVIPQTVQTLDTQSAPGLVVSADGSTVSVSSGSQAASALSPGSILAIGVTPATPYGLLRQVTSVSQSGSQVTAQTSQATLTDVFQQADFTFQTTVTTQNSHAMLALRPGVTIRSGNPLGGAPRDASPSQCATPVLVEMFDTPIVEDGNGTITVSGQIQVCPTFDFAWHISGFSLKSLTATATLGESSHLSLSGNYHAGFDKQVPVATITGDPIVAEVGFVPIVLTPSVTFFVGVSGEVNAGFSAGVSQNASLTGGVSYTNGSFSPVFQPSESFTPDPVAVDASVSAKAYAGLTMDLTVEGVLSPEFTPDAYLQFSADISKNPWWTLSAGTEGSVAVKLAIFGHTLADYEQSGVFDFSNVIAQASGGFVPSNAAPVLSGISQSTAPAGSTGLTLTLTGSNFAPGATAYFNGTPLATTFVTTQQLTAAVTAMSLTTPGTFPVTVANPDAPGIFSAPQNFVVQGASNPLPVILFLSPNSATAGGTPLPVTITGTGFLASSTVTFNGITHAATFSNGQLTITLNASDLSTPGGYPVVVTNPTPGGGSSQPSTFTVQSAPTGPTLQSLTLTPATVVGGGSVTGTIVLSGAAPAGGLPVELSSTSSSAPVPAVSVSVLGGQSSATFTISTTVVSSNQTVTITASLAGVTKTAILTVSAPTVTATVIYAGTDTGIYKSSDGGNTWQQSLPIQPLYGFVWAVLVDPVNHANVYAEASDFQSPIYNSVVYRSTDAGQTWAKSIVISNSDAGPSTLAVDAVARNVVYLGVSGGIYKSSDSGATWQPTSLASGLATADPTTSGVVYATDGVHIYKSSDFGNTWSLLATSFNLTLTQQASYLGSPVISTITIDPQNSHTLYAAATGGYCLTGMTESQCGGIFKSADGGSTWQDLGVAGWYSNISIDAKTGAIYAGGALQPYFGYVIDSGDGGKTWTSINTGLTTQYPTMVNVFVDPGDSSNLYAFEPPSTGGNVALNGIFRSTNGGGGWTFDPVVASTGQLISFGIPVK